MAFFFFLFSGATEADNLTLSVSSRVWPDGSVPMDVANHQEAIWRNGWRGDAGVWENSHAGEDWRALLKRAETDGRTCHGPASSAKGAALRRDKVRNVAGRVGSSDAVSEQGKVSGFHRVGAIETSSGIGSGRWCEQRAGDSARSVAGYVSKNESGRTPRMAPLPEGAGDRYMIPASFNNWRNAATANAKDRNASGTGRRATELKARWCPRTPTEE